MYLLIEYLRLMRLDKPVGFMLLFWPCAFGLAYAHLTDIAVSQDHLVVFLYGSIVMRAVGCVINDIYDRDFDRRVERTKNRPLAKGSIKIFDAVILAILLCCAGGVILLSLSLSAIYIGLSSMLLVVVYPLMKRITFFPQLFLGFTFNIGVLIAFAAIKQHLDFTVMTIYLMSVFWTLGYDTIYGLQDVRDDLRIGVKSTATRFYRQIKYFLSGCYSVMFLLLMIVGIYHNFSLAFYGFAGIIALHLIWQIVSLDSNDVGNCQARFKSNIYLGGLIYLAIYYG